MIGTRFDIVAPLEALSDLRIGSGEERTAFIKSNESATHIATICRDHRGLPVIPATSLKGAARASLPDEGLWGMATNHNDRAPDDPGPSGKIARIWIDDAALLAPGKDDLSGIDAELRGPDALREDGVYTRVNVGLDADLGTAAPNKLFHHEYVASGARFEFRATVFAEEIDESVIHMLRHLSDGIAIGATMTKGAGRMRLCLEELKVTMRALGADGRLAEADQDAAALRQAVGRAQLPASEARRAVVLKLSCEGPFMSKHSQQMEARGAGQHQVAQPLRRDGAPVIWPQSLVGALRARAHWLCQADAEGGPDRTRALFGTTEQRAQLWIEEIACTQGGTEKKLTSVNVDRVTGGARDGLLFSERVHFNTKFEARLSVPASADLWDELAQDLEANGIELGHGASKGYGWFKVEIAQ